MIGDFLFFLFAAMSVLGGLMVITQRNPVSSVMFLILVFFSVAGLFVMLDAHFIGALQVILGAGAIMVLFLFVVMLLNLGEVEWDIRGPLGRLMAGAVGVALVATITRYFLAGEGPVAVAPDPNPVQEALAERGALGSVAYPLFTEYVAAFHVTGLLLLVAMVGTIVLARRKRP